MSDIRYDPQKTVLVFLDEYGNSHLKRHDRPLARYLSVCAILVQQKYYTDYLVPQFDKFKRELFDGDNPYFHYTDIFKRIPPFDAEECEQREHRVWDKVTAFLGGLEITIHNVCIDKNKLITKVPPLEANEFKDPYEYALVLQIERLVFHLDTLSDKHGGNHVARMVAESRTPKQNRLVEDVFRAICRGGHYFFDIHKTTTPERIRKAIPSSKLPFHGKDARIHGLEIADLAANPMFWITLFNYGRDRRKFRWRDEMFLDRVGGRIARNANSGKTKGPQVRSFCDGNSSPFARRRIGNNIMSKNAVVNT